MIIYKLIKEFPHHEIDEILYPDKINDFEFYEFVDEPNTPLPKDIVETSDFFEKIDIDWDIGDSIFFIDINGDIVEQKFNAKKHIKLIIYGNCFKSEETAINISEKIEKLLKNKQKL